MKFRGNIILQYSVLTFAIIVTISVILGTTLTRRITDYELRSHSNLFPEVVRLTVKDDAQVYAVFDKGTPQAVTPRAAELFADFLSLGKIFRVKIWSRDAMILWSDQKDLIGDKFPENDGFQEAMAGSVSYEIAEPDKSENIDEKNQGVTLEIYTPVFQNESVVGVIELYEANRDLFDQIGRNTEFTWGLVLVAGTTIWAFLFVIFLRAYRTQRKTNAQLVETQDVTIFALAYQAELRDKQTGKHLERTAIYVRILAEELARLPQYRSYLTATYIQDLVKSAPLHDIGKVGVPDSILLKPGKLDAEEMEEIKKHCVYGAKVLQIAEEKLKFQSFLNLAIQLTLYHHEKWDGSGYPRGMQGEAIPLSGRIMAIADNYDALRTHRVYKPAFPHAQCVAIIEAQSGKHFDPQLVDAFMRRQEDFERISAQLSD
jgi:HD-GYP domain-containing protein (c-di-GMP phosphodiesterase class II)